MKTFNADAIKLSIAALIAPMVLVPASLLLEILSALFNVPLIPLISGYVFGDGDLSSAVTAAFMGMSIFYAATLLVGVPTALLLRRFHQSSIGGFIITPLLVAAIFSLTTEHPHVKIVIFYFSILVTLGVWGVYTVVKKRL